MMRGLSLDRGPLLPTLLLVPAAVLLGGLLALPLVLGVLLGFKDATIGEAGNFIGLDNYRYLITDPVFRITALNTALYTLVTVVFKLALGLALALILNQRFAGYRFWRSVLLLPYVVPTVLSAFAWWWILDPQFSFISWALVKLGVLDRNVSFLGNSWLARASLMVANIWRGIPFFTVGYLAGLQAIPKELHEAAAIDGAGDWQIFWQITWILLLPLTTILTIFSAIFTFTDFQLIWTITRGGPANATHLFVTLAYQRAIPGGALGEGAAIAGFTLPFLSLLLDDAHLHQTERGAGERHSQPVLGGSSDAGSRQVPAFLHQLPALVLEHDGRRVRGDRAEHLGQLLRGGRPRPPALPRRRRREPRDLPRVPDPARHPLHPPRGGDAQAGLVRSALVARASLFDLPHPVL